MKFFHSSFFYRIKFFVASIHHAKSFFRKLEFENVKDEKFKSLRSRDGSYRFNGEQSYSRSFYRRKKVQWIKNKDWEYRSHFTITNKGGIYEDDEFDKVCDENGILL